MPFEQSEIPDRGSEEDTKSRTSDKLGPLFGFITLIFLFAALASRLLQAMPAFWIFLVLGIGTLIAFVTMRSQAVFSFFVSRQARYGANVFIAVLLVFGIVAIVNVIVAQRLDKTADWTSDKRHTLSDQTKKILNGLTKDVKMIAFFPAESENPRMQRDLELARYMAESYQRETDKLDVEFVDPYVDPRKAEVYDNPFPGTIIFESGSKQETVTTLGEQKFTSAIMKVTRDKAKKIYFLIGHEERAIDDFEQTGYNTAEEALEKQNYLVETLDLTTQPDIPADCDVLVVAGPKAPLARHEVAAISKYLDGNGKLLLMFEPSLLSPKDPNQAVIDLMDKWGVTVGNDLVFDIIRAAFFLPAGRYPEAPAVDNFEFHQITQYPLLPVVFRVARSITPKTETGKLSVKSLAKTTDEIGASWGETERKADGTFAESSYTEDKDTPAPVSLAVAIEMTDDNRTTTDEELDAPKETKTRIVVVGDSDFAANVFFPRGGGDLFLNMVNWLTLEEDLISIRPIDPAQKSLRGLMANEAVFVQLASIFLIPLIVFLIGVVVWWRRR